MKFEKQFLPEDIKEAEIEKACADYLIARMDLEFEHCNYEMVNRLAVDLVKSSNKLASLKEKKEVRERFEGILVKAVPLNPFTIQKIKRGLSGDE
ncbi:hypothetical protein [Salinibacillus xinjiangensis]|uniref:Uncharacterized protein n=1 Tax=Salinibacillus xinjiangensis TaxID=1229268 RepID=A0A6G1X7U4_9BACI|nr:hypothetical protein [Salinibacillus xinjiangensis]MRG86975.1 hypothetical protein [Salinibacillus xinjiangensis]